MSIFSGGTTEKRMDISKMAVIPYDVLLADGQWYRIEAHNADIIEGGVLVVANLVYMNKSGTITRSFGHFFGPGEWRQCKTEYKGEELSDLMIL